MRPLALSLCLLSACTLTNQTPDGPDLATPCPAPPDLAPPPAKCAAAKGLSGDSLLCADFTSPQTLTDLANAGWKFDAAGPNCWTVNNSKLQVNNFPSFMSSCGFLLPPLSSPDFQKYNSFTLAVLHSVDLNKAQQIALIYLGNDVDVRQVASSTGANPRQRNFYEIAKPALPNGGTNSYQPLFKITSGVAAGGTAQGWQIESIAILGNP